MLTSASVTISECDVINSDVSLPVIAANAFKYKLKTKRQRNQEMEMKATYHYFHVMKHLENDKLFHQTTVLKMNKPTISCIGILIPLEMKVNSSLYT